MKRLWLVGIVATILCVSGITYAAVNHAPKASQPIVHANPPTKAQLLALVNAERAKNGVAPLAENPLLDKSAQWKADDEIAHHYFGHVRPGATGNDGLDYLNSLRPPCVYISENLTENLPGKDTSQQAVYSWIQSPVHHEAMIDAKYSLTGFGIYGNEIVEHFCQQ